MPSFKAYALEHQISTLTPQYQALMDNVSDYTIGLNKLRTKLLRSNAKYKRCNTQRLIAFRNTLEKEKKALEAECEHTRQILAQQKRELQDELQRVCAEVSRLAIFT